MIGPNFKSIVRSLHRGINRSKQKIRAPLSPPWAMVITFSINSSSSCSSRCSFKREILFLLPRGRPAELPLVPFSHLLPLTVAGSAFEEVELCSACCGLLVCDFAEPPFGPLVTG